jgi:hypothetical protein
MKLTVAHRFVALGLLPTEGSFVTLRTVRDAQSVLAPSADEVEKFQITQDGEQVRWVGDTSVDVPLSDAGVKLICAKLKSLDESNALKMEHLSLYDMLTNTSDATTSA